MSGIISEDGRRSIQQALRDGLGATWREVSSENSRDGSESSFWIRIEGRHQLRRSARICLDVMAGLVADFGGVTFVVVFLQLKPTSIISWGRLEDGEIRAGQSRRGLDASPHVSKRGEFTVFDRDI